MGGGGGGGPGSPLPRGFEWFHNRFRFRNGSLAFGLVALPAYGFEVVYMVFAAH
jgi:hypothetical protein